MSAPISEIAMAVTEAQAVLQLVADKLRTSEALAADDAFNLYVAVRVAIDRLDMVHDLAHVEDAATPVEQAPEALQ